MSTSTDTSLTTSEKSKQIKLTEESAVDLCVVIVNYNTESLLAPMWDALMLARRSLTLQVIVVDNASRDGSVALLHKDSRFEHASIIANATNVGFGRANNQCLPTARGRYFLLLNTDAFVAPDTLESTVDYMDANPQFGVLGVQLVGSDGAAQPSCRYFPTPWNVFLARSGLSRFFPRVQMVDDASWDHASPRSCDWVTGCYFLIRREVVEQVGLFDPRFFLYCEEVDLCRRVKQAGWGVVFFNGTKVVHLGGESAKSEGPVTAGGQQISALQIESELLYFRKHHGLVGMLTFVMLSWLSDFIDAAKGLIKGRGLPALKLISQHARAVGATLLKTRFGTAPTR